MVAKVAIRLKNSGLAVVPTMAGGVAVERFKCPVEMVACSLSQSLHAGPPEVRIARYHWGAGRRGWGLSDVQMHSGLCV